MSTHIQIAIVGFISSCKNVIHQMLIGSSFEVINSQDQDNQTVIHTKLFHENNDYRVSFWNFQKENIYNDDPPIIYRNMNAIIYLVDSADKRSIIALTNLLTQINAHYNHGSIFQMILDIRKKNTKKEHSHSLQKISSQFAIDHHRLTLDDCKSFNNFLILSVINTFTLINCRRETKHSFCVILNDSHEDDEMVKCC
ncbi:hypothetical protein TRFO_41658 [Tritrichomonas foetus]|uniref:Uncharacterized protein n=1 Tax=Tritrichomonas foetus TaxID=1144522 RepID=A0A1J4KZU4_9EUKA|nr:hypothetical protein TRFO_41658 [Tritrichomonas foetus]|eukprot:OHT16674.1 hypothetical protein TRFO_41658 [Tritrichomonas foetus]